MSQKISLQAETNAMVNIAKELENLPEESKQRIANWLLSVVGNSTQTVGAISNQQQPTISRLNIVGSASQNEDSIKSFFHSKSCKNNYQKLAVLGYYLEFMKGKDEFNAQELKIAWKQTREALPTPQVFANSLNNTISTYNYFVSGSKKGLYRMGIKGQKLVEGIGSPSQNANDSVKKKNN